LDFIATGQTMTAETIKLDQFLKLMSIVQTGGEAKLLIQNGEVKVNGEVETRRGRKLVVGDRVSVFGEDLTVEQDGQ
jgi:ribosome-associated protein